ncbi:hypothetical protein TWF281_001646 [Arthrobotrys megalospora]
MEDEGTFDIRQTAQAAARRFAQNFQLPQQLQPQDNGQNYQLQVVGRQGTANQVQNQVQQGLYNPFQGGNPQGNPQNPQLVQQIPANQGQQNPQGQVWPEEEEKKSNEVRRQPSDDIWYEFPNVGTQINNPPTVTLNQGNNAVQSQEYQASRDELLIIPEDVGSDGQGVDAHNGPRSGRNISGQNASRGLTGASPDSYVRKSDNTVVPLRQLRYVESLGNVRNPAVSFGALAALKLWAKYGGDMGSVTPEDLWAYITRPGIRPVDYLILDTRGEGGNDRLSGLEQAFDRVRVIPYGDEKTKFSDDEFLSFREGVPASTAECDVLAPEVARMIAQSWARYIIVHCAQGMNRSPAIAMALHAYLRRIGSNKKVLLLVGGSIAFWQFVNNPQAQGDYLQRQEDEARRRAEAENSNISRHRTAPNSAEEKKQVTVEQTPGTQGQQTQRSASESTMIGLGRNNMRESVTSPSFLRLLSIQNVRSYGDMADIPEEELDRDDTIKRDGDAFLRYYRDEPAPGNNNSCRPPDRGPDKGNPPGPGGGMGGGGMGGFSGGTGGGMGGSMFTKRSMDPLDIAGGRLRKRSFGIFMPEPRGKGLRVIPRK